MLDMIFSSVLLPEPLRPTIPKNSPWWTSKVTPRSARSSRKSPWRSGCRARSLKESTRCSGIRNVLRTSWTSMTTGADDIVREAYAGSAGTPASQAALLEAQRIGEARVAEPARPPRGAGRERHQAEPVVVELQARRVGERQRELGDLAPEQRRRARDAVGDEQRHQVGVVVAPSLPERLAQDAALGVDEALVAVDELRGAQLVAEGRELVGVPAVVLIAERDELCLGRRHPQRALEVSVEAEAPLGARDREPLVAGDHRLDLREALRARAVVADHAQPAAVALPAQRL